MINPPRLTVAHFVQMFADSGINAVKRGQTYRSTRSKGHFADMSDASKPVRNDERFRAVPWRITTWNGTGKYVKRIKVTARNRAHLRGPKPYE